MKFRFYCDWCDERFESEPDGTGYRQAHCPSCGELAMTEGFHRREADRHRSELRFAFGFIPWPIRMMQKFVNLISMRRD